MTSSDEVFDVFKIVDKVDQRDKPSSISSGFRDRFKRVLCSGLQLSLYREQFKTLGETE